MIKLKRAYEPPEKSDVQATFWMKDAAPSGDLRKWFHGDSGDWQEFRARYLEELKRPEAQQVLNDIAQAAKKGCRDSRLWREGPGAQSGRGVEGNHRKDVTRKTSIRRCITASLHHDEVVDIAASLQKSREVEPAAR